MKFSSMAATELTSSCIKSQKKILKIPPPPFSTDFTVDTCYHLLNYRYHRKNIELILHIILSLLRTLLILKPQGPFINMD